MKVTSSLILLAIAAQVASSLPFSDSSYCYSTDSTKPQRAMFSTKTAYEIVRGRSIDPNVSSECDECEKGPANERLICNLMEI